MSKIVITGAGWAGCAAAIRAVKQGHEVVLLEKTDLLLGLGNVGGIMRNNGRFTAAEENIALGAYELFEITDRLSTHRNVDFPGHSHASFYDVALVEPEVRRLLESLGVEIKLMHRAIDVVTEIVETGRSVEVQGRPTAALESKQGRPAASCEVGQGRPAAAPESEQVAADAALRAAVSAGTESSAKPADTAPAPATVAPLFEKPQISVSATVAPAHPTPQKRIRSIIAVFVNRDGEYETCEISGDIFVETTGSTGPMGNCSRYGNGCSMCVLRCPAFGPRVSLTERAGSFDVHGERANGKPGAFSGSCKLEKRTLSAELQEKLSKDGFAVVPLPPEMVHKEKLSQKVCQQYALDPFAENIILIDTGHAKLMSSYFNLEELRRVRGFENARFVDPYAGGKGNSIRYMSVGLRNEYMRADEIENLFLGGEKSGFFVGHTEAITTGSLAGYNAARMAYGKPLLELPTQLAVGDIIGFANEILATEEGYKKRLTFAGGTYFQRMKELGLYTTDTEAIRSRIKQEGLENIYKQK